MESPTLYYEWEIDDLKKEVAKAKTIIMGLLNILYLTKTDTYDFYKACPQQAKEAEDFVNDK